MRKNYLPAGLFRAYAFPAPAKSGAGIGVLAISTAHNTRPACFFVPHSHTKIMVGCMGASSEAPVSVEAGYANPVQSTTSKIGVFGGGLTNYSAEAAIMATTPTQHPPFIWLIAAVRRDSTVIAPTIHHITATSEQEARRSLVREHVCFFAGRIPAPEARHA